MNISIRNGILGALTTLVAASQVCVPAMPASYYHGYAVKPTTSMKIRGYMYRHPKVKAATVGAGVGTAAGAVAGLLSGRGIMRGAAIGMGTGAGVGLIRSSQTMWRHPLIEDTATGAVTGLGLGAAAGHGHGSAVKAAAVGSAVGLGLGAMKQFVW